MDDIVCEFQSTIKVEYDMKEEPEECQTQDDEDSWNLGLQTTSAESNTEQEMEFGFQTYTTKVEDLLSDEEEIKPSLTVFLPDFSDDEIQEVYHPEDTEEVSETSNGGHYASRIVTPSTGAPSTPTGSRGRTAQFYRKSRAQKRAKRAQRAKVLLKRAVDSFASNVSKSRSKSKSVAEHPRKGRARIKS